MSVVDKVFSPKEKKQGDIPCMWCSWCLNKAPFNLKKPSFFGPDGYICGECNQPAVKCRMCDTGMAKDYDDDPDKLCAKVNQFAIPNAALQLLSVPQRT